MTINIKYIQLCKSANLNDTPAQKPSLEVSVSYNGRCFLQMGKQ